MGSGIMTAQELQKLFQSIHPQYQSEDEDEYLRRLVCDLEAVLGDVIEYLVSEEAR